MDARIKDPNPSRLTGSTALISRFCPQKLLNPPIELTYIYIYIHVYVSFSLSWKIDTSLRQGGGEFSNLTLMKFERKIQTLSFRNDSNIFRFAILDVPISLFYFIFSLSLSWIFLLLGREENVTFTPLLFSAVSSPSLRFDGSPFEPKPRFDRRQPRRKTGKAPAERIYNREQSSNHVE